MTIVFSRSFSHYLLIYKLFCTGQKEVNTLVKKLRKTFPWKRDKGSKELKTSNLNTEEEIKKESIEEDAEAEDNDQLDEQDDDSDFEMNSRKLKQKLRKIAKNSLPQINIDEYVNIVFLLLKMRSCEIQ